MKKITLFLAFGGILLSMGSCSDVKRDPSIVYMPDMYYPTAYDPYEEANFSYPNKDEKSEVPLFAEHKNMSALWPAKGTVPRTDDNVLPWTLKNTPSGYEASKAVKSPLNPANYKKDLERGEKLYGQSCIVCHGEKGDGQGSIVQSKAYSGVPNYSERDITVGSVYHVIMYGKNAMGPYAAQFTAADRWRIAEYVINLRSKNVTKAAAATTETKTDSTATK